MKGEAVLLEEVPLRLIALHYLLPFLINIYIIIPKPISHLKLN